MQPRHHAVNEHKGSHCNSITYALSQSAVKQKLTSDLKQLSFRWPTGRSVPLSGGGRLKKKNPQVQRSLNLSQMTALSPHVHTLPLSDTVYYSLPPGHSTDCSSAHTQSQEGGRYTSTSLMLTHFSFFLNPATFCTTLMTQSKIETLTLSCMGNVSNEDQKEHISNSKRQITDLILTTKTVNY